MTLQNKNQPPQGQYSFPSTSVLIVSKKRDCISVVVSLCEPTNHDRKAKSDKISLLCSDRGGTVSFLLMSFGKLHDFVNTDIGKGKGNRLMGNIKCLGLSIAAYWFNGILEDATLNENHPW